MAEDDSVRLLWSLTGSGKGTTIAAAGDTGSPNLLTPSSVTPIDLRYVDDLALYVFVTGVASSPAFKVSLDGYDDQGNLFPALLATASITAIGAASPVYAGRHGAGGGSYLVLPPWGRLSWTCTGGSVTGAEIALYGR